MSESDSAKQMFDEGMADFIDHNYGKSIEWLTRAIEFDPEFKLAYITRGAARMRYENIHEAVSDFDKVIEMDPEYPRSYHLRGLALEKLGENEKALQDFDKAIELNPEYGAAYHSRATIHTKMGNEDRAVEDIQMATHLTEVEIERFANENNIWRSQHLKQTAAFDGDTET